MYGVEGLDSIGDQVNEFCHDRFDPRRISSYVGGMQEYTIETLIVRAHTQSLPRRPLCLRGVEVLERMLGIATSQVNDAGLDGGKYAFEHYPVGRT